MFDEQYLICGRIGTASDNRDSVQLFREYSCSITQEFRKHRNFFVGLEALKLQQKGVRLITMHIDESKEYDLNIP